MRRTRGDCTTAVLAYQDRERPVPDQDLPEYMRADWTTRRAPELVLENTKEETDA